MDIKISVVMSVYNGQIHLRESINSILDQTFGDFEFIIIDDGSTDNSFSILESAAASDSRIKLIKNVRNMGLAASLNIGMMNSCGKYIARMDADDISVKERLLKQYQYMEKNPDIILLSSWMKVISNSNEITIWEQPTSNDEIQAHLCFDSVLCHPTIMMRSGWIKKNNVHYDESLTVSQDYDFWVRLVQDYSAVVENFPEPLVLYRKHHGAISSRYKKKQFDVTRMIHEKQLLKLGFKPTKDELDIHSVFARREFIGKEIDLAKYGCWLVKLKNANSNIGLYPMNTFNHLLGHLWYRLCLKSSNKGLGLIRVFVSFDKHLCSRLSMRKWKNLVLSAIGVNK